MNRVLPALMVGLATWVLGGPVLVGGPASFLSRAEAGDYPGGIRLTNAPPVVRLGPRPG